MGFHRPTRRFAAVVFTTAFAAALAAACGSGGSTSSQAVTDFNLNCHGCGDGQTIHVLLENWGAAAGTSSDDQSIWEQDVAKTFKADTGATVDFETYLGSTGELTSIETAAASHSGPDVIQVANSLAATAINAGVFSPITADDWKLLGGKSRFAPLSYSSALTGGDMVAQWLSDTLLAYNTKLFKEAGISGPPTTWNQYLTDSQKITALGNGIYGTGFDPDDSYDPWHEIYLMARENGGNFINSAGTQGTLDSAPVSNSLQFWFNLYDKWHVAPPQSITWTQNQEIAAFAQGKIGMLPMTTTSVVSASQGQPAQGNIAFAGMPSVPYGLSSLPQGAQAFQTLAFCWNLGVTSYSGNQSLAYRFLQVATSQPAELEMAKFFENVPSTTQGLAAEQSDPVMADSIKYINSGAAAPAVKYWGSVEVAIANAASKLAQDVQNNNYSASSVQSLLTTANDQVNAAIATTK